MTLQTINITDFVSQDEFDLNDYSGFVGVFVTHDGGSVVKGFGNIAASVVTEVAKKLTLVSSQLRVAERRVTPIKIIH